MSLRVSSMRMNVNYQQQLQHSYGEYTKLFEQSDGRKLHRASDNSIGYSKFLRYTDSITNNEQYQSNVTTALSWMKNSDATLTNVTNTLNSFARKVVDAANSTNNESDMKDIAKELMANIQEIVQDMNIQVGDRYLFSGQADTTLPFEISDEKVKRGLTKTLDDTEILYFTDANETGSVSQMLVVNDNDGNSYYLNTANGKIYTKEFVDEEYKNNIANGIRTVQDSDSVLKVKNGNIRVSDVFDTNGVLKGSSVAFTATDANNNDVTLTFATVEQYIVEYKGDDKYISMVTRQGETVPKSDSVNVTGQDVFGSDIFDCDADHKSGTAMLNELLAVVAQIDNGNHLWASSDGTTVSVAGVSSVLGAQTKLAARSQAYQATQSMLTTQNESLTGSISEVASTNVAELATMLMQYQTIYSMSMSVGSRILPGTLADYL